MGIFLGSSPVKFSGISKAFLGNEQIYSAAAHQVWTINHATPSSKDITASNQAEATFQVTVDDAWSLDGYTWDVASGKQINVRTTKISDHVWSIYPTKNYPETGWANWDFTCTLMPWYRVYGTYIYHNTGYTGNYYPYWYFALWDKDTSSWTGYDYYLVYENNTLTASNGTVTKTLLEGDAVKPDSERRIKPEDQPPFDAIFRHAYPITVNAEHITGSSSNPQFAMVGGTTTLNFTADEGYVLPDTVTVSGAQYTWDKETGSLALTSPTAAVTITVAAEPVPSEFTGLCLTANTAGSTVTLNKYGSPAWTGSYSTDGVNWSEYVPGTTGAITLTNAGDKVYFKGDITDNFTKGNYLNFKISGSIAASGNCNSIYQSENFNSLTTLNYKCCYYRLFYVCSKLTSAPVLPATTLSMNCYSYMFNGCSALITAPELPATTLAGGCYEAMFSGCISLSVAPLLPGTSLASGCYTGMFYSCKGLTTTTNLPATTLVDTTVYQIMFQGCTTLQVSDTPTEQAPYAWVIPSSNVFATTKSQTNIFAQCAGTRASNNMPGATGQKYIYYTQNPVLGVTYKSITYNLTNVTGVNNPNYIPVTDSFPLTFTAAEGYSLPSTVTVTGATGTWDQATGKLTLSDITGDISVSISGIKVVTQIWNFTNATPITANGNPVNVTPNEGYTFHTYTCENMPEGCYPRIKTSITPNEATILYAMTGQAYTDDFNVTFNPTPIE